MTQLQAVLTSRRFGNLAGFLACAGLLGVGYYLQFALGLEPCPLCILQRLAIFATGIAFLAATVHHPRTSGAKVYGGVITVVALVGASISARHVWLQHTPEAERPSCGPGLDYLFGNFGPFDALRRVLRGSGECGVVDWTLLGFSIPELTLAAFLALIVWALFIALRK